MPTSRQRTRLHRLPLILAPLLSLLVTGCAVLYRGTTQSVPFDSNPQGVEVFLDGEFLGMTPLTVELARGGSHALRVRLGEQEREVIVTNSIDDAGGGLIALDVAPGETLAVTAALTPLDPDNPFFGLQQNALLVLIGIGVATAALPLGLDVGTGAIHELSPGEVRIDFQAPSEVAATSP